MKLTWDIRKCELATSTSINMIILSESRSIIRDEWLEIKIKTMANSYVPDRKGLI